MSPQKLKKGEVASIIELLSWFGLLVGLSLMFTLDSIFSQKRNQTVELHWSSLLITSAVTSTCLLLLALYNRKILPLTMVLTLANATWFTISLTIFYMN